MNDPNLENVEQEMKHAENLMYDYAWNGEQEACEKQKMRFIYYRDLLLAGVLYVPKF